MLKSPYKEILPEQSPVTWPQSHGFNFHLCHLFFFFFFFFLEKVATKNLVVTFQTTHPHLLYNFLSDTQTHNTASFHKPQYTHAHPNTTYMHHNTTVHIRINSNYIHHIYHMSHTRTVHSCNYCCQAANIINIIVVIRFFLLWIKLKLYAEIKVLIIISVFYYHCFVVWTLCNILKHLLVFFFLLVCIRSRVEKERKKRQFFIG